VLIGPQFSISLTILEQIYQVASTAVERSPSFRRAYRGLAGIEVRINSLQRDYGLRRCAYHGMSGLKRWLGWGILANNVDHIAQTQVTRSRKKQAA